MNLIEKIIEEKINRYGFWPLTVFTILSTFFLSWFKSLVIKWIKLPFEVPTIFEGIILVIGWILLIIFFLWIWEPIKGKILWPIHSIFRNKINSIPRISKWIFQGSLKITGDSLEITASDSGCLIKDYLYKNFLMN